MRALAGSLLLGLAGATSASAQHGDRTLERIALALQQPAPVVSGRQPIEVIGPRQLGFFTLHPPQQPGEVVRVSIPVGDLVSSAFKSMAAARLRRREEAVRRRVQADVQRLADQPTDTRR